MDYLDKCGSWLLLALLTLLPADATAAEGKRYAVLVGVNRYDHAKLDHLEYAVNDVMALADLLRTAGYQVTLLTDETGRKNAALAPTRANVDRQLRAVLDKCKRDDLVLVAFAGHGVQFEGKPEAYFCPRDARPFPDRTDTLISLEGVYQRLDASGAGVKLLLVDACRNDPAAGRGRGGIDADSLVRPPPKGVFAFYSCSAGERAFEHKDLKHGVFFHHVLEGLQGAAKDADEDVTFEALALYVRKEVPKRVGKLIGTGAKQTPSLRVRDASGASPVVLTLRNPLLHEELQKAVAELERLARSGKGSQQYLEANGVKSVGRWREAANRGAPLGQYLYAGCLLLGIGVAKDEAEAAKWLRKAADQGLATAQHNFGHCLANGLGVPKNPAEAVRWFRKAADQGAAAGQIDLGLCLMNGHGVAKNESEAAKWLREAAEQGAAAGQNNLGICYMHGRGVTKDAAEAVKWFRKAVAQNHAGAQHCLGLCYETGQGVPRNAAEAVRWYRKAAEQGYAIAQYELGRCYSKGLGVTKNEAEAVQWLRKAAEQNVAEAQFNLGGCYALGLGVPKDQAQGIQWLRKAAAQGHDVAKKVLREMGISP